MLKCLPISVFAVVFLGVVLDHASAASLSQAIKAERSGDSVAAFRILRPLAAGGNTDAEFELGQMYEYGEGVPKNATLALFWYRRSASSGVDTYQYRTGLAYETGRGTSPDGLQAVYWLRKAAAQGYAPAQGDLARIFLDGHLVPRDPEQAAFWRSKLESNPHFRRIELIPKR
jgi:hypothetical protein